MQLIFYDDLILPKYSNYHYPCMPFSLSFLGLDCCYLSHFFANLQHISKWCVANENTTFHRNWSTLCTFILHFNNWWEILSCPFMQKRALFNKLLCTKFCCKYHKFYVIWLFRVSKEKNLKRGGKTSRKKNKGIFCIGIWFVLYIIGLIQL